jgi:hypothetical protein
MPFSEMRVHRMKDSCCRLVSLENNMMPELVTGLHSASRTDRRLVIEEMYSSPCTSPGYRIQECLSLRKRSHAPREGRRDGGTLLRLPLETRSNQSMSG